MKNHKFTRFFNNAWNAHLAPCDGRCGSVRAGAGRGGGGGGGTTSLVAAVFARSIAASSQQSNTVTTVSPIKIDS